MFDAQLLFMLGLLGVLGGIAFFQGGGAQVQDGLGQGGNLLLRFGLLIAISFLAAGLAQTLVPREWVEGALGAESGMRGIFLATLAGSLTPAGPFVSMPLAAVLIRSGAAPASVVTFLTAWSLLSIHRLVAWEVPILGIRYALLRFGVSLVLPILAGLLARSLSKSVLP